MANQSWRASSVLLLVNLTLGAASIALRGDGASCPANARSTSTPDRGNHSAGRIPVARLRGGQGLATTIVDPLAQFSSKVSTSTRVKKRSFFWTTSEEPPEEKSLRTGDMVMLQGFDWKLLSDRKQLYRLLATEMPWLGAAGVNTVWFPPPSESADPQGYLPGRWYEIGNRTLLEDAIKAAHAAGVVPMVDVVLNHRTAARISSNSSDWTEFESPDWGEWAIVKDDWKCPPEQHLKTCPDNCTCGDADTGENACYAPDVDHTNAEVQGDVVAWLRWLREELGFDAFRFDNTKGYAGQYVQQYVAATDPLYVVSEFYDSNRHLVSNWLESSGRASTVFDFGLRYKLKEAVKHDDYSLLMDEWMGPMLHYDRHSAVTFTDNHDTAGNHHFAISDHFGTTQQIAAGYAMILSHPSRPCIFWQDWMGRNRELIAQLLEVRARAQVSPDSEWRVAEARKGLYAAFIGERLAMKMGQEEWDPNGELAAGEWMLAAAGDVVDVPRRGAVEPRVVPAGQLVLMDETFEAEGHDSHNIKARVTAFCPEEADGSEATEVTVRVFACDPEWPWPAANDTGKFRVRQGLIMHWAAGFGSSAEWGRPSDDMVPVGTESWREGEAVQSRFALPVSGVGEAAGWEPLAEHVLEVRVAVPAGVKALQMVLKHPAQYHDGEDRWYKADGDFHRPSGDFHIRLPRVPGAVPYWSIWERLEAPQAEEAV